MSTTVPCGWFALCDNETSEALMHPVLGLLPICPRCQRVIGTDATHELGDA